MTVMVNICGVPTQPARAGVTVMVPVVGLVTLAALKLMLPLPVVPSPMAVLLFAQV